MVRLRWKLRRKTIAIALAVLVGLKAGPAFAQAPWVAFDVSFVRTEPGQRKVVGWFHRGRDGSTREESNADGPAAPVVLIMNVARNLQYRLEDRSWSSYPVFLPPSGFHPQHADRDPRKYTPAAAIENIKVFRFVNAQGVVLFVAPDLDDFPLRTEKPGGGRELFSNILIREQPSGLFEPPPGALVHAHADGASGVLVYPAGEMPPGR